jgi:hypothetical protein
LLGRSGQKMKLGGAGKTWYDWCCKVAELCCAIAMESRLAA